MTNVLLIVFDLLASPNWVCRPRWIMLGWLSSFVYPNAASSAFSPRSSLNISLFLKSRAFKFNKAADLLEVTRACGVWAVVKPLTSVIQSFPSLICVPGRKWRVLLRSVTNARLMWQMLHHQGHHIWSGVTEWGRKSQSHLGQILSPPSLLSIAQNKSTRPNTSVKYWKMRAV